MTEERKQELKQLLNEAVANLEIRGRSGVEPSLLPVEVYRTRLQRRRTLSWVDFNPCITSETTKSKLLDFIRADLTAFIHKDNIQSASFFIAGGGSDIGYPLNMLLEQLLKIAIMRGVEGAVSAFDRCTKDTHASFQYMAQLEGIVIKTEIQAFEGVRFVPLPHSTSELPYYLPSPLFTDMSAMSLLGKTVLIIDASVSPIFHKPFPELFGEGFREDDLPFRVEINGGKFPNFKMEDFYEKFCQALSLSCNSAVQISLNWRFLAEDELFNLSHLGVGGITRRYDADSFGSCVEVGEAQIQEAKRLYYILVGLDSNVKEKLQIPINKWIKSKTHGDLADKMIDLGRSLEALYVTREDKIERQLCHRVSWYLGEDAAHREVLNTEIEAIYDYRSGVIHNRELNEEVTVGKQSVPISELVERAQNLCRESIIKIIKKGSFPDWDKLRQGGE